VPRSDCPNKTAHDSDTHTSNRIAGKIRLTSIMASTPCDFRLCYSEFENTLSPQP
jgi:hypothetical protein